MPFEGTNQDVERLVLVALTSTTSIVRVHFNIHAIMAGIQSNNTFRNYTSPCWRCTDVHNEAYHVALR